MSLSSTRRIGALALGAALFVAACGGSASTDTPATQGAPNAPSAPSGVSGDIFVSGSSTVEPITTGVAEAFAASNPDFAYTVEGPGTGDGFKKFCAGETDISDASRKIKDEEAAVREAGIEYVELKSRSTESVLTSVKTRRLLPQLRRPVRARRARVHGFGGGVTARGRQGVGLEHDAPRRRAADHRPRRGVGHVRQLRRARDRRHRRGSRPGRDHPA